MAWKVGIRSFVACASILVGGEERSLHAATGHMRNR